MADLLAYLITSFAYLVSSFFQFLLQPIKWILEFLDAVFYLFYRIFLLLADILHLFLALLQALIAVVAGVFRTIVGFLAWSGDSLHSKVGSEGFDVFVSMLRPLGLLDVLPILLLALDIFVTGYLVMRIIGRSSS